MNSGRNALPSTDITDARKAKLLYQLVLQRPVRPSNSALGAAGIGTENLKIDLAQHPANMCHAVAAFGVFLRHPEDRMLVRVECGRSAVLNSPYKGCKGPLA